MNKIFKKIIACVVSVMTAATILAIPVMADDGVTYTGSAITPEITLYDEDVKLVKDTDYTLSYENNINVGTATIIVTFIGNYSGEKRVTFEIVAKQLTQDDVTISTIENQVFTGEAITPKPEIKFGDVTLVENTDYELTYTDNIHAGTATVTVNFIGNYTGTASTDFEITSKNITDDDNLISSTVPTQTFTGEEITPMPEIKIGDTVLEEGTDYTLTYEDNVNIGEATIIVDFIGDYDGETEYTFTIQAKEATADNTVISAIDAIAYTGSEIKPEPTITVDGRALTKDTDYTLSYENNINVGTATVTVAFIGNYAGTITTEFEITPFVVTDDNISISSIPNQTYTGSEITPEVTVTVVK